MNTIQITDTIIYIYNSIRLFLIFKRVNQINNNSNAIRLAPYRSTDPLINHLIWAFRRNTSYSGIINSGQLVVYVVVVAIYSVVALVIRLWTSHYYAVLR